MRFDAWEEIWRAGLSYMSIYSDDRVEMPLQNCPMLGWTPISAPQGHQRCHQALITATSLSPALHCEYCERPKTFWVHSALRIIQAIKQDLVSFPGKSLANSLFVVSFSPVNRPLLKMQFSNKFSFPDFQGKPLVALLCVICGKRLKRLGVVR